MSNNNVNKNKNIISKANKNAKKRIVFLLFAVVIFIVILISSVFGDLTQIYQNKTQTKQLTEKYHNLLEEEASLNSEVVKLQDPEYMARYAREKYLYTKDGEIILTILDDDEE